MNIKRISIILFLIIAFVILINNYANATMEQNMEVSLKLDKQEYKIGDEVLVDIMIDNIQGFSGINLFVASKVYDSECLEYKGISTQGDWKLEGDHTNFLLMKEEGELKKGKLCTLKFKVLKEVNTTVKLSEIDACGDDGDVYFEDGNVNEPSVEIRFSENHQITNEGKNYTGIVLISVGVLGLIGVGTHYILNKNKK